MFASLTKTIKVTRSITQSISINGKVLERKYYSSIPYIKFLNYFSELQAINQFSQAINPIIINKNNHKVIDGIKLTSFTLDIEENKSIFIPFWYNLAQTYQSLLSLQNNSLQKILEDLKKIIKDPKGLKDLKEIEGLKELKGSEDLKKRSKISTNLTISWSLLSNSLEIPHQL